MNRKLDNGMFVVDVGYRNEMPVALVERHYDDTLEYIIAFNYEIENNKMNWGYGYYYNKDLGKAMEDFKKVLAGGNLADTFYKKERSDKSCNTR